MRDFLSMKMDSVLVLPSVGREIGSKLALKTIKNFLNGSVHYQLFVCEYGY